MSVGEFSHEGLVSHRSAVRGRDFRDHPDLTATDAAWCRAERQSGAGHHLWALPPNLPAGLSLRPTCLPPRLLRLLWCSILLWTLRVLLRQRPLRWNTGASTRSNRGAWLAGLPLVRG